MAHINQCYTQLKKSMQWFHCHNSEHNLLLETLDNLDYNQANKVLMLAMDLV